MSDEKAQIKPNSIKKKTDVIHAVELVTTEDLRRYMKVQRKHVWQGIKDLY